MDEHKQLKGQIAAVRMEKEAVAVNRNACNAKVRPHRTLMSQYPDEWNYLPKRLRKEPVRLTGGRETTANAAGDKTS